jgi:hypothetical protein
MSMTTKLFFCGRGPYENHSWAKLMDEAVFRDLASVSLAEAGVGPDRAFETCRIERHNGEEEDSRVYIWGADEPGFDANDYGEQTGLLVVLDGVEIYNTLTHIEEDGDLEDVCDDDDDKEDDKEDDSDDL